MSGLLNIIIHGNSTVIGDTAASLAIKAGELQAYTYNNYYLKLAAADLCYNIDNKTTMYQKEVNDLIYISERRDYIDSRMISDYKLYPFLFFALNFSPVIQNPCSISLLIPALKVITLVTTLVAGIFKFFSVKITSLAWAYSFFHVTGITILTAFAIPAALLTAAAFYRVLILPHKKSDTKNISTTECIAALSIFIAPIFIPVLFPAICLLFSACFLYNRNFNVTSNYERIKWLLGKNNNEDQVFAPDLSLGFNYNSNEIKGIFDIETSKQERQRYNFGIFFLLSHTAFSLYSTFSITATFATAPLLTGAYVFIMVSLALSAIMIPIYATFKPPQIKINSRAGDPEKITPKDAVMEINNIGEEYRTKNDNKRGTHL